MEYALSKREIKRMIDNGKGKFSSSKRIVDLLSEPGLTVEPAKVNEAFKSIGVNYSFRSISHLNMRGGIGKTTATINLATRATQYGFKTCILDCDPQASATHVLFPSKTEEHFVLADVWEAPQELLINNLVEVSPSLFLLPSSLDNSVLDDEWNNPAIQQHVMGNILNILKSNGFDLVILDAPPSLNCIVISIIAATDQIVVPVWSDPFSIKGLEALLAETQAITQSFKRPFPDINVLFAQYDSRLKLSNTVFQTLKKTYPDKLLKSRIRTSTEYNKSIHKSESVFKRNLKNVATIDYDAYSREILHLKLPSPF